MAELSIGQLLTVAQAIQIIDATAVTPRTARMKLDAASGHRLAADITADRDDPPFNKSLMDGFAVRSGDGPRLRVVGDIPAGKQAVRGIGIGEAMSIMTGAPVPPGADAVVPIEQTARDGEWVLLKSTAIPGQSISLQGSDCAAGTAVLRQGSQLGAAQIAVAASTGAAELNVFAKPHVAVLSTGDEIVAIDHPPQLTQIRNSNSHMLRALLNRLGCEVLNLGIVRDDRQLIRDQLELGMQSDALFVTGGMSMGEYDFVPKLLVEMGVELRISRLRIKPGKPFIFGVRSKEAPHVSAGLPTSRDQFVFGLPGNPVSGYVCTLRLASRLLLRMGGGVPLCETGGISLRKALPANGPREFYLPGVLDEDGGIVPLEWKGSADIYTLAAANALIIREENAPALAIGSSVQAIRMP